MVVSSGVLYNEFINHNYGVSEWLLLIYGQ